MQKTIFIFTFLSIVPLWGMDKPEEHQYLDTLKAEVTQLQTTAIALHERIHRIIDCKDKDFLDKFPCHFDGLDKAMAAAKNEKAKVETIGDPRMCAFRLRISKSHFRHLIEGMEAVLQQARENSTIEVT